MGDAFRKALVFGDLDQFGEEVITGLIAGHEMILLCGNNSPRHHFLAGKHAGKVRLLCDHGQLAYLQSLQVAIEQMGSIDSMVYLMSSTSTGQGLVCRDNAPVTPFHQNHWNPVELFEAIEPYLNKSRGSQVVFIDSDAFDTEKGSTAVTLDSDGFDQYQRQKQSLQSYCNNRYKSLLARNVNVETLYSPETIYPKSWDSEESASILELPDLLQPPLVNLFLQPSFSNSAN